MDESRIYLSQHLVEKSHGRLVAAKTTLDAGLYLDSVNRSYYAAFYALKAVLALDAIDFRRHKDVVAYFNKTYVKKEIFPRTLGRLISNLQRIREKSDYDDYYIVSKEKAKEQYESAVIVITEIDSYLDRVCVGNTNHDKI